LGAWKDLFRHRAGQGLISVIFLRLYVWRSQFSTILIAKPVGVWEPKMVFLYFVGAPFPPCSGPVGKRFLGSLCPCVAFDLLRGDALSHFLPNRGQMVVGFLLELEGPDVTVAALVNVIDNPRFPIFVRTEFPLANSCHVQSPFFRDLDSLISRSRRTSDIP